MPLDPPRQPGKRTLLATRAAIQDGWRSVADKLVLHGDRELAAQVVRFASGMDRPLTERERIARVLSAHLIAQRQEVRTL
jgi:type III secretion system FlhB-like substrate exporter